MKIGILSDSHDNIWKLAEALEFLAPMDLVIHCGDLCSPFVVKRLAEGLGKTPLHIVWGNNDGDLYRITTIASLYEHVHLHGEHAVIEADGHRIAVNHYPEIASDLADSGNYDLVCYGHDHNAHEERRGKCLLLNPGELMGMNGRSSLAIYDTSSKDARFIDLKVQHQIN